MTLRRHDADRALGAVERVRSVREEDSRIGLQQALSASAADAAVVEATRAAMELHPAFTHGSVQGFHTDRARLLGLAEQHELDRERAEASRGVAEHARRRWQEDRTRLRAVEMLLARRVELRRLERDRLEAVALDDLAGQAWLRRRSATARATTPPTTETREDHR